MRSLWLPKQRKCGTPTTYRPRCGPVAPKSVRQPEAIMSVPHSVATIMDQKVTLDIESIDRMYLNVYVRPLQTPDGVAHYFRRHRGAASALRAPVAPRP